MPDHSQIFGVERHSRVTNTTNRLDSMKSPGRVAQFLSGAACMLYASWRHHLPALWRKPWVRRQPIQPIEVVLPNSHSLTAWRKPETARPGGLRAEPAGIVAFDWREMLKQETPRE
jgi:hypothetical protein